MPPQRRRSASPEWNSLVAQVRAGDKVAFETIFHSYFAAVFRFASSFVADQDVAEDLTQDVFSWVWMHRAEWAPSSDILSYLLAAVRNRALDVLRTEKRHAETSLQYVGPDESPAMAALATAADTALEDEERNATVWRVIDTLPEQRRTVLVLRWQHELEWDEIARIMHTTVAAVRMNHSRALKLLRQWLPNAIE